MTTLLSLINESCEVLSKVGTASWGDVPERAATKGAWPASPCAALIDGTATTACRSWLVIAERLAAFARAASCAWLCRLSSR